MNWFRDNILKIIIIIVISIIIIVFAVACSSFSPKTNSSKGAETGTSYQELESKLQNAAIKYVSRNKELLPRSSDVNNKISLETLVNNNMLKRINAIEDNKVMCSGYVEIIKNDDTNSYRYNPYLKCGNYYETKILANYLINNSSVVTSGDGLYSFNGYYIYKGENPDNFIQLDNMLFRILGITSDGNLKLIATNKTQYTYVWDDRFNSEVQKYYGINNYSLSRLKDNLSFLYKNSSEEKGEIYFTDLQRSYMIDYDYCVGKRSLSDTNINSNSECKETVKQKIGLINISDYYNVSTSNLCKLTTNLECNNYNYLFGYSSNTFATMIANADNTYSYLYISDGIISSSRTTKALKLYPVIYLDSNILYLSGKGTISDPYKIR